MQRPSPHPQQHKNHPLCPAHTPHSSPRPRCCRCHTAPLLPLAPPSTPAHTAMFADEAEREQFFEHAKLNAQKDFQKDPKDAQALVRWGGAMLELAHFKQGQEADDHIKEAIEKLEQALEIDANRTDAMWCLGNAYTSMGFLASDRKSALELFDKAEEYFKQCKDKEPGNETYKKALEMCKKAPQYYDEIQTQIQQAQAAGVMSGGGSSGGKKAAPEANEFWWDVAGWVTLGAIIVGVMMTSRGSPQAAVKS